MLEKYKQFCKNGKIDDLTKKVQTNQCLIACSSQESKRNNDKTK